MQYRILFFLSLFSPLATLAQDQPAPRAPMRVVSTDTIRVSKGPIAANVPVTPAIPPKKPVPLAGHKTYFGAMNDYVNTYVTKYLNAHKKTLTVVQERSRKHFTEIEAILTEYDIPHELKYLAVIESALNNKAVSRVGAVGPWQFMAPTARLMGLHVSPKKDERTDWTKSTIAAAKYLSILYEQLNDWLLVVAAYNSGPTPVQRAIKRTGSTNFWDIKPYLPRETQGHVLAFIATASIFEKVSDFIGSTLPPDFDFSAERKPIAAMVEKPKFTPEELSQMAIVRIKEPVSLEFMARELDIDNKLVQQWNDDYELFLNGTYDEPHYSLRLPKDKLEQFLQKKAYITNRSKKILGEQIL